MDDIRAVLDAVDSQRAAIIGWSEGAALSLLFAATYPDRTWALILYGGSPRSLRAPDYPFGHTEAEALRTIAEERSLRERPGYPAEEARSGSPNATEEEISALATAFRYSISPGDEEALGRMNIQIDVRHVLPAIRVPTLVVHHLEDAWVPVDKGRYIAERIPGARFAGLPGKGHIPPLAEVGPVLDEIEAFLEGAWQTAQTEQEPDRLLATVLFTDIVGSSEKAAALGDRAWAELLERHHSVVRRELVRFRGSEVDTAGDGFFASFDGPARAIRCACAIVEAMPQLGLDVRAGLHTGECELVDGKAAGIAVHTGARVASHAQRGEVLVSSTVKDLVAGSGLAFQDRGEHELKGIPGVWRLFGVER